MVTYNPFNPNSSDAIPSQIILHVDMDCFFVSCERHREPKLIGNPVIVGMGYVPGISRGAVATASYEARDMGVKSAMTISKSISLISDKDTDPSSEKSGYYRPVDIQFYKEISDSFRSVLDEFSDITRHIGIDESYLDITNETNWESVLIFSQNIKETIEKTIGLPSSIGVSSSMCVSKIASAINKPSALVIVEPQNTKKFLQDLPIERLPGIGPVTSKSLHSMGINTIGELSKTPASELKYRYGSKGLHLANMANGTDRKKVLPMGPKKSISRESSLAKITINHGEKKEIIEKLSFDIGSSLESSNTLFRTVSIKLIEPPYKIHTRAISIPNATNDVDILKTSAIRLLNEFQETPARKLGVRISNLSFQDANQTKLENWDA